MKEKQHTKKSPDTVSGIGLHTGVVANMTFLPAPVNHGYKFQRVDLPGQPTVDADVDNVVDLSRGTTIEQNGARVNTVEHTLAALVGLDPLYKAIVFGQQLDKGLCYRPPGVIENTSANSVIAHLGFNTRKT